MIRIQIVATITGETADVFALHADVAAAAEDEVMFTVADEGLFLDAVLAVIAPADVLGQITVFASEAPAPAAA